MESVYQSIKDLNKVELREEALKELSKKREGVTELAPLLWHSPGAIAALLQEIYSYRIHDFDLNHGFEELLIKGLKSYNYDPIEFEAYLGNLRKNNFYFKAVQSNRVCNALALLQVLAAHHETRTQFLHANIPFYLYPFLNTNNQSRPFEYLRLTSLGVIGTLVKTDEPDVIAFLLSSGIIPHCLTIMEHGSELSRTVATFIMEKLLLDDYGLQYICQTFERFKHVASILTAVVNHLAREPSGRLLKHVVRCYLRLSDHANARTQLSTMLPASLLDNTFQNFLDKDPSTKRWLSMAMRTILGGPGNADAQPHSGMDLPHGNMSINLPDSRPGSIPGGANLSGGGSN
ncbi:Suppressor of tumorigenicity 7 protein [Cichlidogyrus casuarinus]|uniref:CCR4-NOT transcription complex subunit 9 n=1 Tax=Cichlidogyrus casuarinus TaxID=1844966 RepID=A0ABD2QNP9_9PLAT